MNNTNACAFSCHYFQRLLHIIYATKVTLNVFFSKQIQRYLELAKAFIKCHHEIRKKAVKSKLRFSFHMIYTRTLISRVVKKRCAPRKGKNSWHTINSYVTEITTHFYTSCYQIAVYMEPLQCRVIRMHSSEVARFISLL